MKIHGQMENIPLRALEIAQEKLKLLGFVSPSELVWEGYMDVQEFGSVSVTLTLPHFFPDSLPEVRVANVFPFPLPHLEPEKDGKRKVCIGNEEGLFWDHERPGSVIEEILERARKTIEDGLAKRNSDDFLPEFLAYWNDGKVVASILYVGGTSRQVCISTISSNPKRSGFPTQLLSENKKEAESWCRKLDYSISFSWSAFYLPLEKPIVFPLEKKLAIKEVLSLIENHASEANLKRFRRCKIQLPAVLAISFPLPDAASHALFGFSFPVPPTQKLKEKSFAGFRPRHAPLGHQLQVIRRQEVSKVKCNRFDVNYLLGRSGGIMDIREKKVLVIGCGSVGSRITEKLASAGVTWFCLIDNDLYKNENLYRHVLSMQFVGMKKSQALAIHLESRFPHIHCQFHSEGILEVLEKEEEFLSDFDIAIIATGNETLELRLNQLFYGTLPSIFASVEPLGLGGHILLAGVHGQPGCLRCLYQKDQSLGLNRAFFTAPNQDLRRNHAGCAGSFLPFSSLDADRTALEAANLAVRFLLGKESQGILLSWYGDPTTFIKEGYLLSSRGNKVPPGTIMREEQHINFSCQICSIN